MSSPNAQARPSAAARGPPADLGSAIVRFSLHALATAFNTICPAASLPSTRTTRRVRHRPDVPHPQRPIDPAQRRGQRRTIALLRLRQRFDLAQFRLRQVCLLLLQMPRGERNQQPQPRPPHLGIKSIETLGLLHQLERALQGIGTLGELHQMQHRRNILRQCRGPAFRYQIRMIRRVLPGPLQPSLKVLRAWVRLAGPPEQRVRTQKVQIQRPGGINARISAGWPA